MLLRYAALVKNLRGVVLFNPAEGVEKDLRWLSQRFKYRDLGLIPSLKGKTGVSFKILAYPTGTVERVVEKLANDGRISRPIAEMLCLASVYVCPAVVVGESFRQEIERMAVDVVKVKKMDLRNWKLHMRIADYTALDFYEQATEEALRVLRRKDEMVVQHRRERIARDKRRYWRIADETGRPFLYYVDNLSLLKSWPRKALEEWAACLSIVPVVLPIMR
mgnify:CR=1 FL=1